MFCSVHPTEELHCLITASTTSAQVYSSFHTCSFLRPISASTPLN